MVKKTITIVFIIVIFMACSPQAKLKRNFLGETLSEISTDYGAPIERIQLESGHQLLIYKKESIIKPAIVDPGSHTLDPRVSPGFTKIEYFKFEINEKGLIVRTSYTKEIER